MLLRVVTGWFWQVLHRILHRSLKVLVSDLQVVLRRHWFAVPHPLADNMRRKRFSQFCLTCAPQILEDAGPHLQTGSFDDPAELRPQIDVRVTMPGDDKLSSRFGQIEYVLQWFDQLRKQRNHPRFTTGVMFGLWAPEVNPPTFKVNVAPSQSKMLGRTT